MTGLWPFYENEDDGVVQKKVVNGNSAFIDERYRTYSFGDGKLVELIEKCWAYKPEDRPTIYEVVEFLREAYDDAKAKEGMHASNY